MLNELLNRLVEEMLEPLDSVKPSKLIIGKKYLASFTVEEDGKEVSKDLVVVVRAVRQQSANKYEVMLDIPSEGVRTAYDIEEKLDSQFIDFTGKSVKVKHQGEYRIGKVTGRAPHRSRRLNHPWWWVEFDLLKNPTLGAYHQRIMKPESMLKLSVVNEPSTDKV